LYLQCPLKESRPAIIVFYVLCLLYVLSMASVVSDLLASILEIRNDPLSMLYRVDIVKVVVNGSCDFIAQCILIFRCWIVWGKDIRVVIIPSFLAITYIVTWIASIGPEQDFYNAAPWMNTLVLTGLATSMAVNALMTGLIVLKILKVFLEFKSTSVEQTLGSLSSTGGSKLRHIIFIIIESGMALFAIQLVRVVLTFLGVQTESSGLTGPWVGTELVISIHQVLNGITPTIILVRTQMRLSFDDEESFKDVIGSLRFDNPPSDPNSVALALQEVGGSDVPLQERNEDICFNDDSPSDPNSLAGRVGRKSPQERSEDIEIVAA